MTAHYPGDSTYASSDSNPISVTVSKENSQPQVFLATFTTSGKIVNPNTNTAVYGSPYLLRVNVENSSGVVYAPVSLTSATGCPSGTVSMADNGNPLDAGTYTLNSYGYFEDFAVQLPGGTNSITAGYAGDNSFNSSSATSAITIAPASTSMSTTSVEYTFAGSPFSAYVTAAAQSSGAAPTGTITFSVNGVAVPGAVSYSGTAGSGSNPAASLSANFSSSGSPFPTPGTGTITASYSGDSNYGPSTTTVGTATVKYPPPDLFLLTQTVTVAAGSSVTITAALDTELKNVPAPTGSVTFYEYSPISTPSISGTETYTTTTDAQGNVVLQATLTFTPVIDEIVGANYNGDQNYPSQVSGNGTQITVTGSDFSIFAQAPTLTVVVSENANMQLLVAGQSNYNGTITFSPSSCSGLPTGPPAVSLPPVSQASDRQPLPFRLRALKRKPRELRA